MGQYYRALIITPDERILVLDPHTLDSGAKLTEHSWIGNSFVNAACSLIYKNAKRVAWIGDYAEHDYETCGEVYTKAMSFEQFKMYTDQVWNDDIKGVSPKFFSKRDMAILDYDTKDMFLVNHDKRVYIDIAAYIRRNTTIDGTWAGWCMNPLPLLAACGNGRGGGDYHDGCIGYDDIGIWAFDYLEYTSQTPAGYTETMFYFDEQKEAKAV